MVIDDYRGDPKEWRGADNRPLFKPVRTTVSFPAEVWDYVRKQARKFYAGNVSAYLLNLLTKDRKGNENQNEDSDASTK